MIDERHRQNYADGLYYLGTSLGCLAFAVAGICAFAYLVKALIWWLP